MAKTSYTTMKERADAEAAVLTTLKERTAEEEKVLELSLEEEQQRMKRLMADYLEGQQAEAARKVKVTHIDRGQIHRSKVIDPQEGRLATVTPIGWVTLTPSMCQADPRCSFDGAEATGWKDGYDSIPEDLILPWNGKTARWHAENTLARHISLRHSTTGPAHVRTPEQVKVARDERALPEGFIENPKL